MDYDYWRVGRQPCNRGQGNEVKALRKRRAVGKPTSSYELAFLWRIVFMKALQLGLVAGLSVASLVVSSPRTWAATASAADPDGTPHLLTELQFSATTPMTSTLAGTATTAVTSALLPKAAIGIPGWVMGSQNGGSIGVQATTGPDGAALDALEGSYPVPTGGQYIWADYSVASLNIEDVYVEFWAKMPGPKEGCKFIKVFGQILGGATPYAADATVATNYAGGDLGAIDQISFGDGTTRGNDSQNVINLNGAYPQWIGRSYGTAVVTTPQLGAFSSAQWGTGWHHFRVHMKFNSGTTAQNEVPDGEFYLEIDGKAYVDATRLYNRNPADAPIDHVEFFGWAQTQTQPFQLAYDDIRISTGGFMSQALPEPPRNLAVN